MTLASFESTYYFCFMSEFGSSLNVICLESDAFYALVEEVVNCMKENRRIEQDKWISDEEAMQLLRISSLSKNSVMKGVLDFPNLLES